MAIHPLIPAAALLLVFCPNARAAFVPGGCDVTRSLRSENGDRSTSVTFINNSSGIVRTYWLNYQGQPVFYQEMPPGRSYSQQTYVTHPWVVADAATGSCIAVYLPEMSPSSAVIQRRGTP